MVKWSQVADDELLFEKELLPTGDFVKWLDKDNEIPIKVRKDFLEHLVLGFDKMQEVGVKVPLYKTHREDPDNKRGEIVGIEIKPNESGVDALFGQIKFNDVAARDQGIHNDVSVGIPPQFVDGLGNMYEHPLRHVALTDHPVIPGLSAFTPMILSFDTPTGLLELDAPWPPKKKYNPNEQQPPAQQQQQNPAPPPAQQPQPQVQQQAPDATILDQLLQIMGLTAAPNSTDVDKVKLVIEAVQAQKLGATGAGQPAVAQGAPPIVIPAGKLNLETTSPIIIAQLKTAREQVIDGLVKDTVIDLQQAQSLKATYCKPEAFALELSQPLLENGAAPETEFDRIIAFAKKNRPLNKDGRSPMPKNGVVLSHDDPNSKISPLVEDMMRRREAALKKK